MANNSKTKLGLTGRLLLMTALSLVLVELVIGFITSWQNMGRVLEKERVKLELFGRQNSASIAASAQAGVLELEARGLFAHLSVLKLQGLAIFSPQGAVISRAGDLKDRNLSQLAREAAANRVDKITMKKVNSQHLISYVYPVVAGNGQILAVMGFELDGTDLQGEMTDYPWRLAGMTLIIVLCVMGVQAFIMPPMFTRPIARLRDLLGKAVSESGTDLTVSFDIEGSPEIKELAQSLTEAFDRQRILLQAVNRSVDDLVSQAKKHNEFAGTVNSMSREVSDSIQQITKGAEDQAGKVNEINELMQVDRRNLVEVSRRAEESSHATASAAAAARDSGIHVEAMIRAMKVLHDVLERGSNTIHQLEERSEKIGVVVEVISSIAEQTDLLSLNAAIEAARAGDQGRGFAVVADEVRKLAEESSASASEIGGLIRSIQEETRRAVEEIEKGAAEAEASRGVIGQVGDALKKIVETVSEVDRGSAEISRNVQDQVARSNNIAKSVEDIAAVSEETAASTEEVAATTQEHIASVEELATVSQELGVLTDDLKAAMSKFKF